MGIAAGLSLLWFCDEIWVFGDQPTEGMQTEMKLARNLNIKIRTVSEYEINKKLGDVTT